MATYENSMATLTAIRVAFKVLQQGRLTFETDLYVYVYGYACKRFDPMTR